MSVLKPYSRLTRDRLTAFINNDNDRDRVEGVDFNYGIPQLIIGPNGTNTIVSLIPTKESDECVVTNVYYNRLPISIVNESFYNSVKSVVINSVPFTVHEILPKINDVYKLNLSEDEVENTRYSHVQDTYLLNINNGTSLIWLPGSLQFKATVLNVPSLDNVIYDIIFHGFVSTDNKLSSVINSHLNGFKGSELPLTINIYNTQLNGFGITEISLEDVISTVLDGFDTSLANVCNLVTNDTLDGFNKVSVSIPSVIENNQLPGFTYIDIDLEEIISDVLDGFISGVAIN